MPTLSPTRGQLGGWAGVLGIAVPVAGLIVLPIWRFPGTDATDSQISDFVAEHHGGLQTMMAFYTVGVTLWLVFGACLWARLRAVLAPDSVIPACFAAGTIAFVALLLAGFTAFDILVYRRSDSSNARLLYDLTFGLLAMSGLPTAVALGAYAVGAYRHAILPRYTAHLAAACAAAHTLLLLSFVAESGFLSLEGAVIVVIPGLLWAWILATGIEMLRVDYAANTHR